MSVKLFNGYQIKNMTLLELQEFTLVVREKLEDIFEGLYHQKLADLCCAILDNQAIKTEEEFAKFIKHRCEGVVKKDAPYFIAQRIIREHHRRIKATEERDPSYDFGCEMVIIPIKGKILMLLYTEQSAYEKAIESLPEVTPYPYWNNTDPPEELTEAQWDERENDWNLALNTGCISIPSMCGFTVTCVLENLILVDPANVISRIPDHKKRVERLARGSVMEKYCASLVNSENIVSVGLETAEYLKKEGKAELEKEKKRIARLLKKRYTKEDILSDIQITA